MHRTSPEEAPGPNSLPFERILIYLLSGEKFGMTALSGPTEPSKKDKRFNVPSDFPQLRTRREPLQEGQLAG